MQLAARLFRFFSPSSPQSSTRIEAENIQRIVWIRLDHIGDVVMSLPSLQSLRDQFPDAQIDVLVRPACAPLFADLRFQNRVLEYDSPRFPSRGRGAGLFRTLQLIRKLRRQKYDVAIEPRGDDIARFLCWSSRAPVRIGPNRVFYEASDAPNFRFLMTHVVPISDEPIHAVKANTDILQPLFPNRVLDVPQFRFPIPEQRTSRVQAILKTRKIVRNFVVLHPCSNDAKRNWTPEKWAQIADFLIEKHNFDVVLSGLARDRETHREIIAQTQNAQTQNATTKSGARIHDFAGAIALPGLTAFFAQSRLLVSVDTGPMHIAAFVDTPIVALFLPHLAPRHAPFRQENSVVTPPQNNIEYSISDISVDEVIAAINRKLEAP